MIMNVSHLFTFFLERGANKNCLNMFVVVPTIYINMHRKDFNGDHIVMNEILIL